MVKLQELHSKIDIQIVQLLLSVIPEDWFSIRLDIEYAKTLDDEEGFPMTISNNEGFNDIVMPPDEIYKRIIEHSDIFKEHGKQWKRLTYDVRFDEESENWKYEINYAY